MCPKLDKNVAKETSPIITSNFKKCETKMQKQQKMFHIFKFCGII